MFGGVLFGEVGIFEVIIFFVKIMEFNDKFVQYGGGMYLNEVVQVILDW